MENKVSGDDALLQKLRDSRRRFQRHMQQLLEKVRSPPARWQGREASEAGKTGWGTGVRRIAAGRGDGVWGLGVRREDGEGRLGGTGSREAGLALWGQGEELGRRSLLSLGQGLCPLGPDFTPLSLL